MRELAHDLGGWVTVGDVVDAARLAIPSAHEAIRDLALPPLPTPGDAHDSAAAKRSDECRRALVEVLMQLRFVEPRRAALEAMRRGFCAVPCVARFTRLFTRAERARFVCGDEELGADAIWDLVSHEPEHYAAITISRNHKFGHIYKAGDDVMTWLREVLYEFTPKVRRLFLFFVTGLHGIPCVEDFRILIDKKPPGSDGQQLLPTSSACYNTLHLPHYGSKHELKTKLKLTVRLSSQGGTGEL